MAPRKRMKTKATPEETLTIPLEEEGKKRETLDLISNLPDSLLVHILSLLDSTKDAMKSGVLSRRWKSVWTTIPSLIFSGNGDRPTNKFVSVVNKAIDQCRHSDYKLQTFKVSLVHRRLHEAALNNWIRFAVSRKVEDLELETISITDIRLPQCIFSNSSFARLKFVSCELKPKRGICWNSLRCLSITRATLDEALMQGVLSGTGTPLLETLVLDRCWGCRQLNVSSKSLKVLSLFGYCDNYRFTKGSVKINAPYILSLEIGGGLNRKHSLQNVPALVYAKLDFNTDANERVEELLLICLVQSLAHVKDLEVGVSCSKAVYRLLAKSFAFPPNMKFPPVPSPETSDNESFEYWG